MQRIGTVIVTHNNVTMLRYLIEDLLRQTRKPDEIIIIDNASSDETEFVQSEYPQLHYIRLHENLGSAGGYHEGLKAACKYNEFIWTLDDDLILNERALEYLEKWWNILKINVPLGAVRSWIGHQPESLKPIKISGFAWRGTYIKKSVILDVGLPFKEFFLYAEDEEYSLRISKKGYNMFLIPESLIAERRVEDKMILNIFGKRSFFYKEKFRYYYAFRNQINLYLRHKESYNLFKTFCYAIKVIFLFFLIKPNKSIGIVKAILDGVWDGLISKLGKNQKYLPPC
jgi:rhamnopyranosyl-N-acetylglucosaminyl-diphospho-decaprenol beta-1,3/1,4-galactofuranosyltransferase